MTQGTKVGREGGWFQRWGYWTWVTLTLWLELLKTRDSVTLSVK